MRTTPVAVPAPGLPLADPVDRATYTARKLEHLRWEKEDLSPGALALAQAALDNALDAQANATAVAANTAAVAANTALAALYAGATVWVSGTTYATGNIRYSPANGRVYRRLTAGAGTTDPAIDTTNWTPVNVNSPAQLVTAAVHQAISGQCLALVNSTPQAAATNRLLYSGLLDNPAWNKGNTTITPNVEVSPYSGLTGDKLVESATNATHFILQSVTGAANVSQLLWCVAKYGGRTTITLEMDKDGLGVDVVYAYYDLTTGIPTAGATGGTASGVSTGMLYLGAGWYLCYLAGTPSTTAGTTVRCLIYLLNGSPYLGDGSSGAYFAHMQNELGSAVTSRIETTSAPVTRPSGEVAPQRVVLPPAPAADAFLRVVIDNGIYTNMVDPNGQTLEDLADGVMSLDAFNAGSLDLQFINGTWRVL